MEDGAGSEGKILMKLKLPQNMAVESEVAGEPKMHNCPHCDRSFTTGKALGGHTSSAHVKSDKNYVRKKLKPKNGRDSETTAPATEFVCNECDRSFPSLKSLHGHMRSHPKRDDRGLKSKTKVKISFSANPNFSKLGKNCGDDGEIELGSSEDTEAPSSSTSSQNPNFKTWSKTGKRGRAASPPRKAAELEEAAEALVKLKTDYFNVPPTYKKLRVSEDKLNPPSPLKTEALIEIGVKESSAMAEPIRKKKSDKAEANPNQKHTCDICKKSFPTHQALGGHMSSHRKFKISVEDNATTSAGKSAAASHEHVCKVCRKVYASEKALGKHVRKCHGDAEKEQQQQQQQQNSDLISMEMEQKLVLNFDLNEVPEEEEKAKVKLMDLSQSVLVFADSKDDDDHDHVLVFLEQFGSN
ncbi:zinc finger protein ZAT9-like [Andrographis paniculata]|uniref:zinc finger protein ZAT9-like n=1 Tax=Andrographis paniculata TaxID=175694 RepID=UPI0021E7A5F2|nr:zinc finger protein ZAT9-like [Andrographis paniculata]